MLYSIPFQSQCKTAVLYRLNHSIPLYTTLPLLQNVTYNIPVAQNMRDTVPYHAPGHTTTIFSYKTNTAEWRRQWGQAHGDGTCTDTKYLFEFVYQFVSCCV